jgi:hypothetical protein
MEPCEKGAGDPSIVIEEDSKDSQNVTHSAVILLAASQIDPLYATFSSDDDSFNTLSP